VNITDPEMIRDVFNKMYDFQKPNANPLGKLLANGLASHEGEQWSKHRKIINPAFHIEKLKESFPLLDIESNCVYLVRNI
jgi:cytochrome P450